MSLFSSPTGQLQAGLHYFIYGIRLLMQASLLPFVIWPIVINLVMMIGLIWLFFANIGTWLDWMLPDWLEWLSFLLIPLIFLMILVIFYFTFTALANFIAAPFNALLAEKVEQQLTGQTPNTLPFNQLLNDVPRMLKREWQKITYSIPRLIALFVLSFVPVLGQTVIPILTFMFGSWLLAIQYCDYPFDNHRISFSRMRNALSQQRLMNFSFGALVSLFTFIPFINLLVMPVAVCGAAAMWVKEYRDFFLNNGSNEFEGADFTHKEKLTNAKNSGSLTPRDEETN